MSYRIITPAGRTIPGDFLQYQAAFNYRAAHNLVGHRIVERGGEGRDAYFHRSSFGGGWIVPTTGEAAKELRYLTGERETAIDALEGARGWIVEPADVESVALHMKDAGFIVELAN